ncbi:hypothetical protein GCM10010384_54420 [Streptomyces djakartensis]|uniref:Uncharacterized protein n=1 Tax=Streptomyces djakartensis TaxID=68193 RepID=A0ABQ3ABH0_9ACTN|nr:hypothetical protein GCM10010384_54420 [Streptomyces djakartensis]
MRERVLSVTGWATGGVCQGGAVRRRRNLTYQRPPSPPGDRPPRGAALALPYGNGAPKAWPPGRTNGATRAAEVTEGPPPTRGRGS